MEQRWQFWIDRGGTFTDIGAQQPNGQLIVHKLSKRNAISDHSSAPDLTRSTAPEFKFRD